MSAMFCTMSSSSSSSKQYMTSLLMIYRIGVCGPLSAPTARMAMSRSVIMPDQSVVLSDRQHPGVDLGHQARGIADRLIGTGNSDVVGHRFTDLHGISPRVFMPPVG